MEAPGLEAILSAETESQFDAGSARYYYQGPRFTVGGFVYFNLGAPFDPEPEVPASPEEARAKLFAVQDVGGEDGWRFPEHMPIS